MFKDCHGSSVTALECCTLHVHQGGILWFTWPPPTHLHLRLITTDGSKLDLRPCWSAVPRWSVILTFVSLAWLSHFPSALLTSPSISPYRPPRTCACFLWDPTWKCVSVVTVLDWTVWRKEWTCVPHQPQTLPWSPWNPFFPHHCINVHNLTGVVYEPSFLTGQFGVLLLSPASASLTMTWPWLYGGVNLTSNCRAQQEENGVRNVNCSDFSGIAQIPSILSITLKMISENKFFPATLIEKLGQI